jgi:citrate synthase
MSQSKTDNTFEDIKDSITGSLNKLLTHGEVKPLYDPNVVVNEILNYIKNDIKASNQANRYEEYYRMTGKAVTIAEAWLKNYSDDVKHYEDTQNSICQYILRTYGNKHS